jgi:hypothetical protein
MKKRIGNKNDIDSKIYINLLLFTLLILIIYVTTKRYIKREVFIYSWDYIGYQKSTDVLIEEFHKSFLTGILEFINSLFSDYSKIFCIPILPFYLAFGTSRLSFILSLGIVYITSFSLVMGVVFSNLITKNRLMAFWMATFITLATPATWIGVLRGYPDIGGASIFLVGILLYWKDISLSRKNHPLKIAALMSALVLYRRHFAYAFRSFIITITLQVLTGIGLSIRRNDVKYKLNVSSIKRIFLLLILFLLFSIHLVIKTFYFNYRELYSSYEETFSSNIEYYGASFGFLFIFLSVIGFLLGLSSSVFNQQKLKFIGLLGLITIFQWVFFSRQIGVHYTSHFLPFVIVGISSLIWSTGRMLKSVDNKSRYILLALAISVEALLLLVNFNIGIANINILPAQKLFARQEAPLVRSDYPDIVRFIKYLKNNSGSEDSIYVAASSYGILNKSIVEEGEKNLYKHQTLNILRTSDIDSRDFYPLNGLLSAHYVVTTDPTQYHINPDRQKVITLIGEIFRQKQLISNDFEEVREQFIFQKGVRVHLYKRVKPTSTSTALSTLNFMERTLNRKLGRETYWLNLNSGQETVIERDALFKTIHLSPVLVDRKKPGSLLYFGEIYKSTAVNGKINAMSNCPKANPIILYAKTLDLERNLIDEKKVTYFPNRQESFEFILNGQNARYLALELDVRSNGMSPDSCRVALNHVVVSKQN